MEAAQGQNIQEITTITVFLKTVNAAFRIVNLQYNVTVGPACIYSVISAMTNQSGHPDLKNKYINSCAATADKNEDD